MTDPITAQRVQALEHLRKQYQSLVDQLKAEVHERSQRIGELQCRMTKIDNEISTLLTPGNCR